MSKSDKYRLGQQLRGVREGLGLTQEEVAQHLGLSSYQIVSYIESGKRELKASELVKLLRLYHKDIPDLFPPEKEMLRDPAVLWRSKEDDKKALNLEKRFLYLCRNYRLLETKIGEVPEEHFEPWRISKTELNFEALEDKAREISEDLRLGNRPAGSLPKILAEQLYLKIIYLDLRGAGSAASTLGDFGPAILLNTVSAPWRRNFDLAHEYFHILTWETFEPAEVHCGEGADDKSPADKLANVFASALLLPENIFRTELKKRGKDRKFSGLDLVQLAMEFEVSTEAVLWRMVNLRLLEKEKAREIIESPSFRTLHRTQRKGRYSAALEFSRRLVYLGLKAMVLGLVSRAKLAEIFQVPLAELDNLFAQYGLSEEEYYSLEFTTA